MNTRVDTLPDLQRELARTHRARLARRRMISTGAVALPAIALVFVLFPSVGKTGFQPIGSQAAWKAALPGTGSDGTDLKEGASVVTDSSAPPPSPLAVEGGSPQANRAGGTSLASTPNRQQRITIQPMTDEELLAALAEAGQPSGLITINGHTTVVANRFPDAPSPFAPFGASISADRQ